MNNKMTAAGLVLSVLAFPIMAKDQPSETMSLNYEEIKNTPVSQSPTDVGTAGPKINGGLNRDIIRRKALKAESKEQTEKPKYDALLRAKPKDTGPASNKGYAPKPQKGIEPDEIDRK